MPKLDLSMMPSLGHQIKFQGWKERQSSVSISPLVEDEIKAQGSDLSLVTQQRSGQVLDVSLLPMSRQWLPESNKWGIWHL